jgi:hypothetical protein
MEKQIKNAIAWIEALISGEYKQGYGYLGDDNGYCCWGLGCKIVGVPFMKYNGWNNVLYSQIGFKNCGGSVSPLINGVYENLANANDSKQVTFKEIGDYLIANPDNFVPEVAEGIRQHFKQKTNE